VLLFVLLCKCEILYNKQFKRQIRNAFHVFKQQFYDTFLFRQQDEPLSGKKKKKHQTHFHCAWKPPTKKNSYFSPVKFSISRHTDNFPTHLLLSLFVKVTGSLFQMTLNFQDNINIIPSKSKLKR
jgi:hypothetical protein